MSKRRRKSTGGQKAWLEAQLLAHIETLGKNTSRFSTTKVSLGAVTAVVLPEGSSDPYGLGRLDEPRRVLLVEGAVRRLERQGLLIFHPYSKKIERARGLLEVLAYVSRTDQEIRETG